MGKKNPFFIYNRKEIFSFFLFGITATFFAFTLGIHLGTSLSVSPVHPTPHEKIQVIQDSIPRLQKLLEKQKYNPEEIEKLLNHFLHQEVLHQQIKLVPPQSLELPKSSKSKNAGATLFD